MGGAIEEGTLVVAKKLDPIGTAEMMVISGLMEEEGALIRACIIR